MSSTIKKKPVEKEASPKEVSEKKVVKKKTAKKKVVKKKAASTTQAPAKKPTKPAEKSSIKSSRLDITPEERWKMVAVAAYHRAEKRNFAPGNELLDWTESEKEIDKFLHG